MIYIPAQTFIDYGVVNILDKQGDISKILHKIEPDLYHYQPKVSKSERNEVLDGFENNHPTLKPIYLNKKY